MRTGQTRWITQSDILLRFPVVQNVQFTAKCYTTGVSVQIYKYMWTKQMLE